MRAVRWASLIVAGACWMAPCELCQAGMPALLPTSWTADSETPSWAPSPRNSAVVEAHVQAISFFVVCLLASGWAIKGLWNVLRRDFPALPALGYGRALSLVLLWGLCFVVVLTMISGARELMTPGAWRKQGWTYALAETQPAPSPDLRRQALERLRFVLWEHAARNEGRFPKEADLPIDDGLWQVPGWPGLQFLYVEDRSVRDVPRLLAFEPMLDGNERLALLTNGFIGWMRTAEIERDLAESAPP